MVKVLLLIGLYFCCEAFSFSDGININIIFNLFELSPLKCLIRTLIQTQTNIWYLLTQSKYFNK